MDVKEWLNQVSYITTSDIALDRKSKIYKSKFDDSYITRVGMEENIKVLADREITEELTSGVGFSPKDKKWYGWSHRAIYGFKIGSTCKKGDCHYRADTLENEIEDAIRFWSDSGHVNVKAEKIKNGELYISWEYDNTIKNKKMRGTISGACWNYNTKKFGKGEWTAKTMEDAKQMAIDFNEGVS